MTTTTLSDPTLGLLVQVAADTYTLNELKSTLLLRADLAQERYVVGTDHHSRVGMVRDRLLRAYGALRTL